LPDHWRVDGHQHHPDCAHGEYSLHTANRRCPVADQPQYIRPPAIILKDVVLKPGSVALNTAAQTFDISVNLSIA
jgi:hypothetical protein